MRLIYIQVSVPTRGLFNLTRTKHVLPYVKLSAKFPSPNGDYLIYRKGAKGAKQSFDTKEFPSPSGDYLI